MNFKHVHHVAIICSDYEKSKDFYVNKLGLTMVAEHFRAERNSWKLDLQVGDKYQIEIFSFPKAPLRVSRPEACGLRHLAFAVDDLSKTKQELEGMGIVCEDIRTDAFSGKKFTFFSDPDELPLEIYEV